MAGAMPGVRGLEGAGLRSSDVSVLCEALLQRLVPAIKDLIEDVAANVASRTLQNLYQGDGSSLSHQGTTVLGTLQPGKAMTVDWTFTNSGSGPWPAGARLRFAKGSLGPPQGFTPAETPATTPVGGSLTVAASMVAPQEPGPCEGHWQLEGGDGVPLSPPLVVRGVVVAAPGGLLLPDMLAASRTPSKIAVRPLDAEPAEGVRLPGNMPVSRQVPVPLVAHVRSGGGLASARAEGGGYPMQQTPPPPPAPRDDAWSQQFEDFFGHDVLFRLRQMGTTEQQRMLSQVWNHLKLKGLCRGSGDSQAADSVMLDETLGRLYGPVLRPGTTKVRTSDILPLTQQIISKYKEQKSGA